MAWFKRESGELDTSGRKTVRTEGLWVKCEGCRQIIWKKDLEENLNVCPKCDKHFRIDARTRLAQLLDESQFEMLDGNLSSTDPLKFVDLKPYSSRLRQAQHDTGLNDAVINAQGKLLGRPVVVSAMEYAFIGGSMGAVVGEMITRAVERALAARNPLIIISASGGARMMEGSKGYWGKFPDVFDGSFGESLRRSMGRKADRSAGDSWCLGYFSDNEMSWGNETSLGLAALQSPADQAAKKAFVADLQAKYGGVEQLNQAWGAHYPSWDGLRQSREAPDTTRAAADLGAFYTRAAEEYFRTVREAIKAVAPSQLYLGCRFAWVNPLAAAAAAKYCDVVSYNIYHRSVADFHFNGGADVPLLIGEFHFGALDRGLFHPGLVWTANQAARAQAYKDYVTGALRHPQFVGCHWFEYQDEPTIGRALDEENYQIGFVDVADTPYDEMVAASRELAGGLYRTRMNSP